MEYREVAELIVEMREAKGLTQAELAKLAGVPQASISGWENWRNYADEADAKRHKAHLRRPPIPDLARIAAVCGRAFDLRFPQKGSVESGAEVTRLTERLQADDRELLLRLARGLLETDDFRETLATYVNDIERLAAKKKRRKA